MENIEVDVIDTITDNIDSDAPEIIINKASNDDKVPDKTKFVKLPLARVRNIMKMDPDCTLISQDAVYLTGKATELFILMISKATVKFTNQSKRKTVLKRDLEKVIETASNLCFLDGMLE